MGETEGDFPDNFIMQKKKGGKMRRRSKQREGHES
jgi:hypothetical protein